MTTTDHDKWPQLGSLFHLPEATTTRSTLTLSTTTQLIITLIDWW
jgi:hypothetical protein